MVNILSFDIGLKNLAYCIMNEQNITALENCNIVSNDSGGDENKDSKKIKCSSCSLSAKYSIFDNNYCRRHVPKTHKILCDISGVELSVIPSMTILKDIAKHFIVDENLKSCLAKSKKNKQDYLQVLNKIFAIPLFKTEKKGGGRKTCNKLSLQEIHDHIYSFVNLKWDLFSKCDYVLLENQPVFKNPHMKSVQVLLFAVLRDKFLLHNLNPEFHLIHAKNKVSDAESGDAGYSERKHKSEKRVYDMFNSGKIKSELQSLWESSKKKSDMADAICMCVDYMNKLCKNDA